MENLLFLGVPILKHIKVNVEIFFVTNAVVMKRVQYIGQALQLQVLLQLPIILVCFRFSYEIFLDIYGIIYFKHFLFLDVLHF